MFTPSNFLAESIDWSPNWHPIFQSYQNNSQWNFLKSKTTLVIQVVLASKLKLVELVGAILNQGSVVGELAKDAERRRRRNKRSSVVKVQARRLSPVEIIELIERYETGASTRQLASEFGVTRTTVVKHLQARGFDTAARRVKRKLTSSQVQRCAEMYVGGMSLATIAEEFDVHASTVRRELISSEVQLRPRQGWKYS